MFALVYFKQALSLISGIILRPGKFLSWRGKGSVPLKVYHLLEGIFLSCLPVTFPHRYWNITIETWTAAPRPYIHLNPGLLWTWRSTNATLLHSRGNRVPERGRDLLKVSLCMWHHNKPRSGISRENLYVLCVQAAYCLDSEIESWWILSTVPNL